MLANHVIEPSTLKELKKEFIGRGEVIGFEFRQIRVTNRGFLYEVTGCGIKRYEVFKKRVNTLYGTYSYPRSKSFGKWAWAIPTLERAIKKVNSL